MSEAAGIIRRWWKRTPPESGWHMGRELSIWKRLIRLDEPEVVNGAMTMLPLLAPNLNPPSLRHFYGPRSGPLYEQCKAEWMKGQAEPAPTERTTVRRSDEKPVKLADLLDQPRSA